MIRITIPLRRSLMPPIDRPYMLDTNVFNDLFDEKISPASLGSRRWLVTGIQLNELGNTKNSERRAELLAMFEEVDPATVLSSSFAFGIEGAGFCQASWNDGSGKVKHMLQRLRELDAAKHKKRGLNQDRDVIIAETAIKNDAILVSRDENLRKVVTEFGGPQ
jgi:predicted nucleic acid-binding protein